jgi:two-component system NtrC family sensor kinase
MEGLNTIIAFSLLPVWVLVGLFQYLSRFTGKRHFKTWTSGWLFYALFLTLNLAPQGTISPGFLAMSKNWCIATAAILMLWGSFQFINVPAKQRLIAMMIVFNLMWSYVTTLEFPGETWIHFPSFAFLALASGFTAYCFLSKRGRRAPRGASLLTFAFSLWALFLLCSPFFSGSQTVLYTGFMAASVLQLFIAISMMVLVLEETRGKLQVAVVKFSEQVQDSSRTKAEADTVRECYRTLFENSKEAVLIVCDEDLQILDLNAAARKLFRMKTGGTRVPLQSYCSLPNNRTADAKTLLAALPDNPELELSLQDGAKIRARVRTEPLRFFGQKARQLIFSEIAQRASLAGQLHEGGKISALGQVISGIAHELNNPLATIKGYADLLLLASQVDSQTRSALTKVAFESNRAAKLVHDLLAFARPETPQIQPLHINDALESFLERHGNDVAAKEIVLATDFALEDPIVLASRDQIREVLEHLIQNAVDSLEQSDGDRLIKISTRSLDSKIQILVEDSGGGIPDDVLPRIFEPFFTTKPVGTGTGLGLSVCYSIMLHHKGRIFHQSTELGGAGFVLELPAVLAPAKASQSIQPAQGIQPIVECAKPEFRSRSSFNRPAKLLVVDDESTVGSLLKDMLSLLGHDVTVHVSPYDALADIQAHDFDAILSDFRMPGMTGGDLYHCAVSFDPRYARRFIFLTGDMMNGDTHDFFQKEKLQYILKPFQLSSLQSALAMVLEQADATDRIITTAA